MTVDPKETQLRVLLRGGARPARELQQLLGVSQPTFSRLIRRMGGGQVMALGKGRATLYAMLRDVRGLGASFPIFQIDGRGDIRPLGILYCLYERQYWWGELDGTGELFTGLPWFLQDMRPEGFVGRAFALQQAADLGLPARLSDWTDDDVLVALSRRGEDCVGNLIIGEDALSRYLHHARVPSTPCPTATDCLPVYTDMAQAAMAGGLPGSSAGGEQPKFTTRIQDDDLRHVLVKFSPTTDTQEGRRWADLLVCEHVALQVVARAGFTAARTRILQSDQRVFLEVHRFDREGTFGRLPVVSLGAVDGGFHGQRDTWAAAADRLERDRMVSPESAECLRWLYVFGGLIANTDQHFGNISLVMQAPRRFVLAPAYDMLPMLYRPVGSELPSRTFNPPSPPVSARRVWDNALEWALGFWQMASGDVRISPKFREICEQNHRTLQTVAAGPRLVV